MCVGPQGLLVFWGSTGAFDPGIGCANPSGLRAMTTGKHSLMLARLASFPDAEFRDYLPGVSLRSTPGYTLVSLSGCYLTFWSFIVRYHAMRASRVLGPDGPIQPLPVVITTGQKRRRPRPEGPTHGARGEKTEESWLIALH
jgi:hypothetical protein